MQSIDIDIKKASAEDLPEIGAVISDESQSDIMRILGFVPGHGDIQRQTTDDPDYEPDLFLGAFDKGVLVGTIMGIRRPWKETRIDTGFIKWIMVKKQYRKRGVGRMLLQACESGMKGLGVRKIIYGSASPLYFFPGVPKESDGTVQLLESCGWQKLSERVSFFTDINDMATGKEELDGLLQQHGSIAIDIALPEDREKVSGFIENEFSLSWLKESTRAIKGEGRAFCSVLYSTDKNDIRGFAVVDSTNPNWFGPMGVQEDQRKKGYGSLLVYHSVLEAQKRGFNYLIFPWINGKEDFYEKVFNKVIWQTFYKFKKQL